VAVKFAGTRDIAISELTRYPGNARRGDVAAIRESVSRLGQYRSLVVRDTGDALVILAGNHTRDALEAEGRVTARCEVITCTGDEARRVNLADNRLAEMGSYENEALAELLRGLDGDYDGTGWTGEDLAALLSPPADDLPEPGDAETGGAGEHWGVIVECDDEAGQVRLLEELGERGWRARALLS
jgi:ParB-like chromosome segregation protein Spo0J